MLETNEHLADAAAGSSPPPTMIEEDLSNTNDSQSHQQLDDPAYIQTLRLLAEKKVREAEEKAKRDEEAEWFAAAEQTAAASANEGGSSSAGNHVDLVTATENRNTEDILQSIEDSVDYNNQTSGFVTSFALPLSPIVPFEAGNEADDYSTKSSDDDVGKSSSTSVNDNSNNHHNVTTSRQQRASSPASIFRTASSSSSATSQTNKGVSSPSSPYDGSVASDSTDVANNNASTSLFVTPSKLPQHQLLVHVDEGECGDNTNGGKTISPLASPVISQVKQPTSNNRSKEVKNTKGSKSPTTTEKQSVKTQRMMKRKNNLVISPLPISKKKQLKKKQQQNTLITAKPTTKSTVTTNETTAILPAQTSNKPPTHPSTKPSTTSSPSFQPILRTQSDADTSIDLSEATPITTPSKSSWFRSFSGEDEEGEGDVVGSRRGGDLGAGGDDVDNDDENDNDDRHEHVGKGSQSSADLVGLEIFEFDNSNAPFATNDDVTPKNSNLTNNNFNNNFNNNNNNNNSMNYNADNETKDFDSLNSSTEYTTSSFFNPKSNRQYSDGNLFFNGIYESGLESSSFEQVDNGVEDRMCTDAEIELVYNSSGVDLPSFLMEESSVNGSFMSSSEVGMVVADDLEECASVEERREVVRRIRQWRRGRARESSSGSGVKDESANDDGGAEEEDEHDFNYDHDDDAIEMAPLTPAKNDVHDSNRHNTSNGHGKSTSWRVMSPTTFFGDLLWKLQPSQDEYSLNRRSKKPHYDDIDFDRNTDKCYHCFARWKKLMIISTVFLLFGSLMSGDGLEKHHDDDYGENDPLARSNFIEHGRIPDDTDDYDGLLSYHSLGVPTHLKNDADMIEKQQQTTKPGVVADDVWFHFEMEDDEFDTPLIGDVEWPGDTDEVSDVVIAGSSTSQSHLVKAEQYNALVGIDTIVVLGDHHSGQDWLVDKLKRLYPDLIIRSGFKDNDGNNIGRALRGSTSSQLQRITKVIDPLSNEVIHHLGGADDNGKEDATTDSEHTLVLALFLNPYDWVALMHSSPQTYEKSWRDYLSTKWESYANILEYRASMIKSAVVESMEREDVKLVIPLKYEKLVDSFGNFDNYVSSQGTMDLPGIVGVIDDIQSHTGLRADEDAGWKEPRDHNMFWADQIGCTGHICHPIQTLREDAEYVSYINEHVDWKTESMIGYQQMMPPKLNIEQIVVLGERHSGAEWLVDRLSRCYPDIAVKYGFDPRPGKFFQKEPTNPQPNTLVISVFVNPFDWVDMMRRNPINAPTHKDLDWTDFVTTPWERKRSKMDNNLESTADAECSFGFSYEEVIPCMTQRDPNTDVFPFYELRPDGSAYANLLELREDKIKNFLGTANFAGVVDHIPIRYEDLVWDDDYTDDALYLTLPFPGIAGLLEKIRDQTKLIPDINAGWILDEDGVFRAEPLGVGVTKLDPYFVQWMEDNVNWDAEDLVGYLP